MVRRPWMTGASIETTLELGADNEMNAMWGRTGQLWLFVGGGTLQMSRFYSNATALLIKSDLVRAAALQEQTWRGPWGAAIGHR